MHFLVVLGLALATTAMASDCPQPAATPRRIVSLVPAITETLFAIGAGDAVVGVSDYCAWPPEVTRLPRLGTTLTPAYETIARMFVVLSPTIYALIIIGFGSNVEEVHREALIGGGRWWFATYMILVAVIGGFAGRYGLPQHLPPQDDPPALMKGN